MTYRNLVSTLPILALLAGCDPEPRPGECLEESDRSLEVSEERSQLISHNADFAWAMFEQLREDEKNLFFSPISMSAALDMTRLGARGETLDQMASVLGESEEELLHHDQQGSLLQELEGSNTCSVALSVANRIFPQEGLALESDFEQGVGDYYGAPLAPLDFAMDPEAARSHINDWVSEETREKIPELFPEGSIGDSTRLVLANAIYMKADWAEQFDPQRTSDTPFSKLDGSSVDVAMMQQELEEGFYFAEIDGAQIAELPYVGEELSMVVVVPEGSDGLLALEAGLDATQVQAWFDALAPAPVSISMPKLEIRWKDTLNEPLQALGMEQAFLPTADFSGMSSEISLYIDLVIHEAFVKIDEEGTEAAAATGVGMEMASVPDFHYVVADHPFLFLVRDRITDSVLFVGRVADPTAG